ncbi:MAG: regulatory iron-sulfur-containing complex subunit RicT [Flavobacteriaceae bacterium]|nr:regulatory iron-sulfur-containing complex subunit RicT [Flavobacteriaceae bacterium]
MSCGCRTSGDSSCGCSTKSATGCEKVDTCGNSYKLKVFDWLSNIKSPQNECDFVEVRFKNDRKGIYHNVNKLPLHIGSIITVESNPGHDTGVVSLTGELVRIQMRKKNIQKTQVLKVYRIASQKDVEIWQTARKKEDSIKIEARKIAQSLNLEMKITDVEFQGDGSKITFYYTAEGRVDFRQLIKEYAVVFRSKIDMKQIGYRQEAAKVGGIGSCGRELCCSTWLTDFRSVNTNAARYQQLSINPLKLAGQCGKLKCCLNFELDSYVDALSHFPSSNTILDTEKGKAFCIKIDVFKRRMWFAYMENSMIWHDLSVEEVKKLISINKKGKQTLALEDYKNQDFLPVKEVDLIQESNIDRFEKKKNNRKKPKNKPQKAKELNSSENPIKEKKNTERNNEEQKVKNKPKKFHKKPKPPKRNDNE